MNHGYTKIKNSITYHLDKFLKDSNILLITGLSGAGKTTLSKELQEQLKKSGRENVIVCELDKVLGIYFHEDSNEVDYNKLIKYINKCKEDKDHIYIIEGVHMWLLDYYDQLELPLIILVSNMIKCIYNVWKRSGIINKQQIKQYIRYNREFRRYKKIIKEVNQ